MGQVTTVVIDGVTYSIYGERDPDALTAQVSADEYLGGSLRWSTTWAGATPDNQSRALVDGTRYIDSFTWAGTRTSGAQPLDWPRTGVTYADGTAVDPASVPDEVVEATYLLAAMLTANPKALETTPTQAGNIAEVGAGTARVKFFRPLAGGVMADAILALLGQFLGSRVGGGVGPSYASGTSDESSFDAADFYTIGRP